MFQWVPETREDTRQSHTVFLAVTSQQVPDQRRLGQVNIYLPHLPSQRVPETRIPGQSDTYSLPVTPQWIQGQSHTYLLAVTSRWVTGESHTYLLAVTSQWVTGQSHTYLLAVTSQWVPGQSHTYPLAVTQWVPKRSERTRTKSHLPIGSHPGSTKEIRKDKDKVTPIPWQSPSEYQRAQRGPGQSHIYPLAVTSQWVPKRSERTKTKSQLFFGSDVPVSTRENTEDQDKVTPTLWPSRPSEYQRDQKRQGQNNSRVYRQPAKPEILKQQKKSKSVYVSGAFHRSKNAM